MSQNSRPSQRRAPRAAPRAPWRPSARDRAQRAEGWAAQVGPGELLALLVISVAMSGALLALSGVGLASAVTGGGWVWPPASQLVPVTARLLVHLDDPAAAYPPAQADLVADPLWCWVTTAALALSAMVAALGAVRPWMRARARRSSGMADPSAFAAPATPRLRQRWRLTRASRGRRAGRASSFGATGGLVRQSVLDEPVSFPGPSLLPEPYAFYEGRGVYARAEDTAVVLAPARVGKSVRLAVPLVVDAVGAVVATSTRADLVNLTEGARSLRGRVHVFDPDRLTARPSLRWNFVAGCEDPRIAVMRARILVSAHGGDDSGGQDSANSRFFNDAAAKVLRCLLHAAALRGASMREVLSWARNSADDTPYSVLRSHPRASTGWAEELAGQTRSGASQTAAGVSMTLSLVLDALSVPEVLELLCPAPGAGFQVEDFLASRDTLYLLSSGSTESNTGALTTALVAEVDRVSRLMSIASATGRVSPPLTLVLDEAANIAALPSLPSLMSEGGGRGVITWAFFQSAAQMASRWGQLGATTIFDSASIHLVMGGLMDPDTLGKLAALCGQRSVMRTSVNSGERGGSRTTSMHREDVISQAEIRQLEVGSALLLYRHLAPAVVYLPAWWERGDAAAFDVTPQRAPTARMSGSRTPGLTEHAQRPAGGALGAARGLSRWARPPVGPSEPTQVAHSTLSQWAPSAPASTSTAQGPSTQGSIAHSLNGSSAGPALSAGGSAAVWDSSEGWPTRVGPPSAIPGGRQGLRPPEEP